MTLVAEMKILGHFFLILFILVLMFGIYVGSITSKLDLDYDNPLRSMPLNSYDFNTGAMLAVWFSGLSLLIAAMVFYWMDHVTSTLDGMQANLKQLSENANRIVSKLSNSPVKRTPINDPIDALYPKETYSKSGDAPEYPRAEGESDSDYWERVSKRKHFSDTPKQGDDPRYPRYKDELDYDYWGRVKQATVTMSD